MDRFKGIAKGGWKPAGDAPIHRDSWKSDLKGIATGKKKDPYEYAHNHTSAPLSSLKDPDSFGPPPKHTGAGGLGGGAGAIAAPSGGLGSPVPTPSRRQQRVDEEGEEKPPSGPYRADTTGLRTDNLPKPPVRRGEVGTTSPARTAGPGLPSRNESPSLPPRQTPYSVPRQNTGPPPILPPRMNENPTEDSPLPPPRYEEASRDPQVPEIPQGAAARLGQAGVSVPGFGINPSSAAPQPVPGGQGAQLSELQQRFARMKTGEQRASSGPAGPAPAAVSAKKPKPPPPPKKSGLAAGGSSGEGDAAPAPPPLPLASKPRPGG